MKAITKTQARRYNKFIKNEWFVFGGAITFFLLAVIEPINLVVRLSVLAVLLVALMTWFFNQARKDHFSTFRELENLFGGHSDGKT